MRPPKFIDSALDHQVTEASILRAVSNALCHDADFQQDPTP